MNDERDALSFDTTFSNGTMIEEKEQNVKNNNWRLCFCSVNKCLNSVKI